MRKFILFLFILINSTAQAQLVLRGTVLSQTDSTAIPFVTVTFSTPGDTSKTRLLADLNGQFVISGLSPRKYAVSISSMGYAPLDTTVTVRFPSTGGTTVARNFFLREDAQMLDEVVKTASATVQSIDGKTYLITKSDLRNAVTGIDLLRKVPYVTFDMASQTLKSNRGGSVKLMINGVSADKNDVFALDADEIKKIVVYDFPPARYAGYSVVLNYITKKRISGFNAGLSTMNAFSTGYSNDGLHLKYNHGYNQFSLAGNLGYRDYDDIENYSNYEYELSDDSYQSEINGKRKFGYDDTYISAAFNRYIPEKYQLNILFSPNIQHTHLDEQQDNIFSVNKTAQNRTATVYSRTRQFVPSLDIYYNVMLKNSQELTFDVVGTMFNAKSNYKKNELAGDSVVYLDEDHQNNKKHSLITELTYSKTFKGKTTLSVGNRFSYSYLKAQIENSFDNTEYKTKMFTNYAYAELKGLWKKFMYRISLGLNYYSNDNREVSFTSWTLQPQVIVGRKLGRDFMLRGLFSRTTLIPTLSDLSNNRVMVTENIVKQGNPNLENSTANTVGLVLDYTRPWLVTELQFAYAKNHNAFNNYFVQDGDYICQKNENAKYEEGFAVSGDVTFMPFPKSNLFTAKLSASYEQDKINSRLIGIYRHHHFLMDYELQLNISKFHATYQGNVLSWQLQAPYLEKGEKVSTLSVAYYPKDNISISASVLWLGRDAIGSSKTVDGSIVRNRNFTNIHDNKNMFTIGLVYRFKTGKSYVNKDKNIHNQDTDSGIN
ncbi:MAG: TonB-dependent receptor [Prevotella sp.]